MSNPIPGSPIVNAGTLYANGLGMARTGNKTITMAAGAARDYSNTNDIILNSLVTLNGTNVGVANGIDTAALVATAFYAVYVIGDSNGYNPTAGFISPNYLTGTTVNLPPGYNMLRRVGWIRTDGSANILQFWQYGYDQMRKYYWDVAIAAVAAANNTTYSAASLASSIPPIVVPSSQSVEAILNVSFTAGSAADIASFLPFGSTETNGIVVFGTGVAAAQVGIITVPTQLNGAAPTIQYKVTAGGDSLTFTVAGFTDYIA